DLLGSALAGGSIQQSGERRLGERSPGGGSGMGGVMMALLPVVLSMLASRGSSRQGGGGLGDILSQVLGGAGQSPGSMGDDSMPGSRAEMGGGTGGLGALLEQMQQAGLGDQARSWVGAGENMPISPDVLGKIFGDGGIGAIARQAGLTPKETSDGLSQLLPEVVNHVTPAGEVPDFDELTRSIDDLRGRMGG